ncbi:MAG: Zn-dependent exopeptidase M28, partial [Chloroflexi bacterium]|nr:Zn-dependent exopeptidase M28 [Chloroflexota bacterium]
LGLNLLLGRVAQPSQGAVDNGAACAVLLGLAQRLASAKIELARTQVTLAIFAGEEVNMQGSAAYVRQQDFPLPLSALNLELVGQNGPYILWRADGNAFTRIPTSQPLNDDLSAAVLAVTGERVQWQDYLNSDTYSFLSAGIPAATLGSLDNTYGVRELHRPTDNVARVAVERLPECVDILATFIKAHDDQATKR